MTFLTDVPRNGLHSQPLIALLFILLSDVNGGPEYAAEVDTQSSPVTSGWKAYGRAYAGAVSVELYFISQPRQGVRFGRGEIRTSGVWKILQIQHLEGRC